MRAIDSALAIRSLACMREVRRNFPWNVRETNLSQQIAVYGWQKFAIIFSIPARDTLKGMLLDWNNVPPGRHVLNAET